MSHCVETSFFMQKFEWGNKTASIHPLKHLKSNSWRLVQTNPVVDVTIITSNSSLDVYINAQSNGIKQNFMIINLFILIRVLMEKFIFHGNPMV